jgi:hypothetical protein
MQKTLSTLLWIKGREKANEYSGSHTPTQSIKQEPRQVAGFFVYRHLGLVVLKDT